ncbi:MAG TPA: adenosylcobinamide-GDP ribazoletransferase, partial [Chthoniobacterales bacterium]|nr:adenosylcobinamide-GDP ribazoletransferase [Chthoniobacterales bacterium]
AVLFCMAASVCSTGGLHEDGLADAADGLIAGHDAQQRLEIMRDSRLGTYGALALWFSLTAKLFLLHALLAQGLWLAIGALVVAHACGRMSSVALLHYCPYARAEESKSKPFGNSVTMVEVSIALTLTVAFSFLVIGDKAALCLLGATLMTGAVSGFVKKRIGGVTGDCLGAANQLVELTCYAVLIAQLRVGES